MNLVEIIKALKLLFGKESKKKILFSSKVIINPCKALSVNILTMSK